MMDCRLDRNKQLANDITIKCFEVYGNIGKKGKPQLGREWTKMTCIVQTNSETGEIHVISLATGTKCIGKNQRSSTGYLLNDSHAEVLARRLFLKYLYRQLMTSLHSESDNTILSRCPITKKFRVKNGIKFHLFSTDVPCGDASIFPKMLNDTSINTTPDQSLLKRKHDSTEQSTSPVRDEHEDSMKTKKKRFILVMNKNDSTCSSTTVCDETDAKKDLNDINSSLSCNDKHTSVPNSTVIHQTGTNKHISGPTSADIHRAAVDKHISGPVLTDIHRTGAKCVPGGNQDLLENGENYHVTGVLRIKPGRGDRTLSLSCSDKIMKWCVLGLQGGLLANFLNYPIYLDSIIISDGPFDQCAFYRALSLRDYKTDNSLSMKLNINTPLVLQSDLKFVHSKENVMLNSHGDIHGSITPTGTSILYCSLCDIHEVSANGRKHGITKKYFLTPKSRCSICKYELFDDFKKCHKIMKENDTLGSYHHHKHACKEYTKKRLEFFQVFSNWIQKPSEHEEFL